MQEMFQSKDFELSWCQSVTCWNWKSGGLSDSKCPQKLGGLQIWSAGVGIVGQSLRWGLHGLTSSSPAPALFRAFLVPLWPGVLRGQGDRADQGGAKPSGRGLQQPCAVCARQRRRVSVGEDS